MAMQGLYVHAGSHPATLDEVRAVPTPARTATWCPVPHATLYERIREQVDASGLRIAQEQLALSGAKTGKPGDRFFGLMTIKNGDDDFALTVGVRNSHDKRFPAGLCVGTRVFVCDNLAFSAEIVLARKHTRWIESDLPGLINRAVGKLNGLGDRQHMRISAYKTRELDDMRFHDLCIRAVDADVIAASKLPQVIDHWRKPQHAEFAPRTVWSAFNGFTETLKGYDLQDLPRRTTALHGLCDLLSAVN